MRQVAAAARRPGRVYVTGGATAVLEGWRASTIDVDLKMVPEQDEVFRAIPRLKEQMSINVELASPADFIPELPGWSPEPRHSDRPHAEVLSLRFLRAGAREDRTWPRHRSGSVEQMIRRALVDGRRLLEFFHAIEPQLVRDPALDPTSFQTAVEAGVARFSP